MRQALKHKVDHGLPNKTMMDAEATVNMVLAV